MISERTRKSSLLTRVNDYVPFRMQCELLVAPPSVPKSTHTSIYRCCGKRKNPAKQVAATCNKKDRGCTKMTNLPYLGTRSRQDYLTAGSFEEFEQVSTDRA
jgi:hypothetical protein